jgi:hypothetical protein
MIVLVDITTQLDFEPLHDTKKKLSTKAAATDIVSNPIVILIIIRIKILFSIMAKFMRNPPIICFVFVFFICCLLFPLPVIRCQQQEEEEEDFVVVFDHHPRDSRHHPSSIASISSFSTDPSDGMMMRRRNDRNYHHEHYHRKDHTISTDHWINPMEEARVFQLDNDENDVDIPSLNPDLNRSLVQSISMECVHNENEIRVAIDNALNFVTTRIPICSSLILLNASEPNAFNMQGIIIDQKSLEFHCQGNDPNRTTTTTTRNCIWDAQSLSRMFLALNSNLTFHGIDFINGNANGDSRNSNGGAFYIDLGSNIKLMNCGFKNNTARSGGAMIVFNSIVVMMVHENQTIPSLVQYNVANRNGGFIAAQNSSLEMYSINMKHNAATFGGAIYTFDSALKLIGSGNPTLPTIVENNVANVSGGFIFARSSTLEMNNINMKHNTASGGGAIITFGSALKLTGSEDPTLPTIVENNEANSFGGFIYAENSTLEMYNINMKQNTATYGGAIDSYDSTLKLIGSDNPSLPCIVENNKANYGGGFIQATNSTIQMSKINMKHNTAIFGGAIVTLDSALKLIGSDNPTLRTIVENNEANDTGGFIFAQNSTLEMYNINMKNNTAASGGAITTYDSTLTLIGSDNPTLPTIGENNIATEAGGVVIAINTTLEVTQGYFLFQNNIAKNVSLIFISFLHCHSVFGSFTLKMY